MSCDNPNCSGPQICEGSAETMHRMGFGLPCEWRELEGLPKIIDLPEDPERIGDGELGDYLSAYYDDMVREDG